MPSPGGVRSIAMNVFVCLSVCTLACLKNSTTKLPEIFFQSSSNDSDGICYVLPVLWMTSRSPILGPMITIIKREGALSEFGTQPMCDVARRIYGE